MGGDRLIDDPHWRWVGETRMEGGGLQEAGLIGFLYPTHRLAPKFLGSSVRYETGVERTVSVRCILALASCPPLVPVID